MVLLKTIEKLRFLLNSNSYPIGFPLPSERELSNDLQVSRSTIRKAINKLVECGLIEKRQGSGNIVIGKDPTHSNQKLYSFTEHINLLNRKSKTIVTKFELCIATPSISSLLNIKSGDSIYYIRRLRCIEEQVLEVEDSYLPLAIYKGISISDLEKSKFKYIEDVLNIKIKGCTYSFDAVQNEVIAKILNTTKNTPLLMMTCINNTVDDDIVDYSEIFFNPKNYRVEYYAYR